MINADKSLLIYDTCESGGLAAGDAKSAALGSRGAEQMAAYERMKERTGRLTLSASSEADIALEGYRGRHGILTYAVLEAIALGDANRDREIALTELFDYVGARVPEISCEMTPPRPGRDKCYKQVPQASYRSKGSSFPLLPQYAAANPNADEAVAGTEGAIGQAAPDKPTHVIIQPVQLLEAIGGKPLRDLPIGFQVTKVKAENGWVLIARDGKTAGYVKDDALAALQ